MSINKKQMSKKQKIINNNKKVFFANFYNRFMYLQNIIL